MRMNLALTLVAVLSLLFGIGFLLLPNQMATLYAVPMDALAIWMSRLFGVALLSLGMLALAARTLTTHDAQRPFAAAFLFYSLLGVAVTVWMALSPLGNLMIWATVLIYAVLVAVCAWALLEHEQPSSTRTAMGH